MKRSTIAFVQMFVIFTIILVHECSILDSDAIVFSDEIDIARTIERTERPMEQQRKIPYMEQETKRESKRIRNEAVFIGNRNIIKAPSRNGKSCPVCQRLDALGNCHKILNCVP